MTFTITGKLVLPDDSTPVAGEEVRFSPVPRWFNSTDDAATVVQRVAVTTGDDGSFTATLDATSGVQWRCASKTGAFGPFTFDAQDDGATVDFADLLPVPAVSASTEYVRGEGVPSGGASGQVLAKASSDDFDTAWVTSSGGTGGGGGAVDSVNGKTGVVELTASDVGALPDTTVIPDSPDDIGAATSAQGALADSAVQPDDLAPYAKTADVHSVPAGGTTGQVLAKISSTDYDTQWTTPSSGGGGGSSAVVQFEIGVWNKPQTLAGSRFTTIDFGTTAPTLNVGGGTWASNGYTIPTSGVYLLHGSVRRGTTNAGTIFLEIGTTSSDGPTAVWMPDTDSAATRLVITNTRPQHLNAGDVVKMTANVDNQIDTYGASMAIFLLAADN